MIARSVELFVLKPYCKGFKMLFLSRNFLIVVLTSKIFSNILEKIGNKTMGRNSSNDSKSFVVLFYVQGYDC